MILEAEINQIKNELVKKLKDYCQSQVVLWRQVPDLAQGVNRLRYFTCGRYLKAYCGFWPVFADNLDGLSVNLETGELTPDSMIDNITLGRLNYVTEALDAKKVINLLMNEIKPTPHVLN